MAATASPGQVSSSVSSLRPDPARTATYGEVGLLRTSHAFVSEGLHAAGRLSHVVVYHCVTRSHLPAVPPTYYKCNREGMLWEGA